MSASEPDRTSNSTVNWRRRRRIGHAEVSTRYAKDRRLGLETIRGRPAQQQILAREPTRSPCPCSPCSAINVIADFYRALGFRITYRQSRPNPYVALQRKDLHLHFFGIDGFVPANSYSSCLVLMPDVQDPYKAPPRACVPSTAKCW
jgi:hypothetical protein